LLEALQAREGGREGGRELVVHIHRGNREEGGEAEGGREAQLHFHDAADTFIPSPVNMSRGEGGREEGVAGMATTRLMKLSLEGGKLF
jgi:hypothetical protein